ncbi:hypothetical protein TEA_025350 [Camellia sinensis var. sinensis]|uniref:Uncharacterized protein n=1 Tax=Camellia sinensis var. sinensis TaxID=542762 RepID=A0A4S4CXI9_CAMSN|nr:hypothetical protein TEA_025350 [Camellia sinensis var. sinensis]
MHKAKLRLSTCLSLIAILSTSSSLPTFFMASKPFLKFSHFTVLPTTPSSQTHLFHTKRFIFSTFPSKPISNIHPFSLKNPGFSSVSDANIHTPVYQLYGETLEENGIDLAEMKVLRRKIEELGIDSNLCKPGQYNHLICPMGRRAYPFSSLQMGIELCGPVFEQNVAGEAIQGYQSAYVNGNSTSGRIAHIPKVKQTREITEKSLDLEPPCSELRVYFAERMISWETLRRNAVMQRRYDDQGTCKGVFVVEFFYSLSYASSVIHLGIAISKFDFEHRSVIHLRGFGTLHLLQSEVSSSLFLSLKSLSIILQFSDSSSNFLQFGDSSRIVILKFDFEHRFVIHLRGFGTLHLLQSEVSSSLFLSLKSLSIILQFSDSSSNFLQFGDSSRIVILKFDFEHRFVIHLRGFGTLHLLQSEVSSSLFLSLKSLSIILQFSDSSSNFLQFGDSSRIVILKFDFEHRFVIHLRGFGTLHLLQSEVSSSLFLSLKSLSIILQFSDSSSNFLQFGDSSRIVILKFDFEHRFVIHLRGFGTLHLLQSEVSSSLFLSLKSLSIILQFSDSSSNFLQFGDSSRIVILKFDFEHRFVIHLRGFGTLHLLQSEVSSSLFLSLKSLSIILQFSDSSSNFLQFGDSSRIVILKFDFEHRFVIHLRGFGTLHLLQSEVSSSLFLSLKSLSIILQFSDSSSNFLQFGDSSRIVILKFDFEHRFVIHLRGFGTLHLLQSEVSSSLFLSLKSLSIILQFSDSSSNFLQFGDSSRIVILKFDFEHRFVIHLRGFGTLHLLQSEVSSSLFLSLKSLSIILQFSDSSSNFLQFGDSSRIVILKFDFEHRFVIHLRGFGTLHLLQSEVSSSLFLSLKSLSIILQFSDSSSNFLQFGDSSRIVILKFDFEHRFVIHLRGFGTLHLLQSEVSSSLFLSLKSLSIILQFSDSSSNFLQFGDSSRIVILKFDFEHRFVIHLRGFGTLHLLQSEVSSSLFLSLKSLSIILQFSDSSSNFLQFGDSSRIVILKFDFEHRFVIHLRGFGTLHLLQSEVSSSLFLSLKSLSIILQFSDSSSNFLQFGDSSRIVILKFDFEHRFVIHLRGFGTLHLLQSEVSSSLFLSLKSLSIILQFSDSSSNFLQFGDSSRIVILKFDFEHRFVIHLRGFGTLHLLQSEVSSSLFLSLKSLSIILQFSDSSSNFLQFGDSSRIVILKFDFEHRFVIHLRGFGTLHLLQSEVSSSLFLSLKSLSIILQFSDSSSNFLQFGDSSRIVILKFDFEHRFVIHLRGFGTLHLLQSEVSSSLFLSLKSLSIILQFSDSSSNFLQFGDSSRIVILKFDFEHRFVIHLRGFGTLHLLQSEVSSSLFLSLKSLSIILQFSDSSSNFLQFGDSSRIVILKFDFEHRFVIHLRGFGTLHLLQSEVSSSLFLSLKSLSIILQFSDSSSNFLQFGDSSRIVILKFDFEHRFVIHLRGFGTLHLLQSEVSSSLFLSLKSLSIILQFSDSSSNFLQFGDSSRIVILKFDFEHRFVIHLRGFGTLHLLQSEVSSSLFLSLKSLSIILQFSDSSSNFLQFGDSSRIVILKFDFEHRFVIHLRGFGTLHLLQSEVSSSLFLSLKSLSIILQFSDSSSNFLQFGDSSRIVILKFDFEHRFVIHLRGFGTLHLLQSEVSSSLFLSLKSLSIILQFSDSSSNFLQFGDSSRIVILKFDFEHRFVIHLRGFGTLHLLQSEVSSSLFLSLKSLSIILQFSDSSSNFLQFGDSSRIVILKFDFEHRFVIHLRGFGTLHLLQSEVSSSLFLSLKSLSIILQFSDSSSNFLQFGDSSRIVILKFDFEHRFVIHLRGFGTLHLLQSEVSSSLFLSLKSLSIILQFSDSSSNFLQFGDSSRIVILKFDFEHRFVIHLRGFGTLHLLQSEVSSSLFLSLKSLSIILQFSDSSSNFLQFGDSSRIVILKFDFEHRFVIHLRGFGTLHLLQSEVSSSLFLSLKSLSIILQFSDSSSNFLQFGDSSRIVILKFDFEHRFVIHLRGFGTLHLLQSEVSSSLFLSLKSLSIILQFSDSSSNFLQFGDSSRIVILKFDFEHRFVIHLRGFGTLHLLQSEVSSSLFLSLKSLSIILQFSDSSSNFLQFGDSSRIVILKFDFEHRFVIHLRGFGTLHLLQSEVSSSLFLSLKSLSIILQFSDSSSNFLQFGDSSRIVILKFDFEHRFVIHLRGFGTLHLLQSEVSSSLFLSLKSLSIILQFSDSSSNFLQFGDSSRIVILKFDFEHRFVIHLRGFGTLHLLQSEVSSSLFLSLKSLSIILQFSDSSSNFLQFGDSSRIVILKFDFEHRFVIHLRGFGTLHLLQSEVSSSLFLSLKSLSIILQFSDSSSNFLQFGDSSRIVILKFDFEHRFVIHLRGFGTLHLLQSEVSSSLFLSLKSLSIILQFSDSSSNFLQFGDSSRIVILKFDFEHRFVIHLRGFGTLHLLQSEVSSSLFLSLKSLSIILQFSDSSSNFLQFGDSSRIVILKFDFEHRFVIHLRGFGTLHLLQSEVSSSLFLSLKSLSIILQFSDSSSNFLQFGDSSRIVILKFDFEHRFVIHLRGFGTLHLLQSEVSSSLFLSLKSLSIILQFSDSSSNFLQFGDSSRIVILKFDFEHRFVIHLRGFGTLHLLQSEVSSSLFLSLKSLSIILQFSDSSSNFLQFGDSSRIVILKFDFEHRFVIHLRGFGTLHLLQSEVSSSLFLSLKSLSIILQFSDSSSNFLQFGDSSRIVILKFDFEHRFVIHLRGFGTLHLLQSEVSSSLFLSLKSLSIILQFSDSSSNFLQFGDSSRIVILKFDFEHRFVIHLRGFGTLHLLQSEVSSSLFLSLKSLSIILQFSDSSSNFLQFGDSSRIVILKFDFEHRFVIHLRGFGTLHLLQSEVSSSLFLSLKSLSIILQFSDSSSNFLQFGDSSRIVILKFDFEHRFVIHLRGFGTLHLLQSEVSSSLFLSLKSLSIILQFSDSSSNFLQFGDSSRIVILKFDFEHRFVIHLRGFGTLHLLQSEVSSSLFLSLKSLSIILQFSDSSSNFLQFGDSSRIVILKFDFEHRFVIHLRGFGTLHLLQSEVSSSLFLSLKSLSIILQFSDSSSNFLQFGDSSRIVILKFDFEHRFVIHLRGFGTLHLLQSEVSSSLFLSLKSLSIILQFSDSSSNFLQFGDSSRIVILKFDFEHRFVIHLRGFGTLHLLQSEVSSSLFLSLKSLSIILQFSDSSSNFLQFGDSSRIVILKFDFEHRFVIHLRGFGTLHLLQSEVSSSLFLSLKSLSIILQFSDSSSNFLQFGDSSRIVILKFDFEHRFVIHLRGFGTLHLLQSEVSSSLFLSLKSLSIILQFSDSSSNFLQFGDSSRIVILKFDFEHRFVIHLRGFGTLHLLQSEVSSSLFLSLKSLSIILQFSDSSSNFLQFGDSSRIVILKFDFEHRFVIHLRGFGTLHLLQSEVSSSLFLSLKSLSIILQFSDSSSNFLQFGDSSRIVILKFDFEHRFVIHLRGFGTTSSHCSTYPLAEYHYTKYIFSSNMKHLQRRDIKA